jgi:hypothetical protein
MSTKEYSSFIEAVEDSLDNRRVYVACNVGTLPLEWPKGSVTDEDVTILQTGKILRTNRRNFRNIETAITGPDGIGAQSGGVQVLNLDDDSHPFETDAEFLERIEDWIAHSKDPRIAKCGVRVERKNPHPVPFIGWDTLPADTVLEIVAQQLTDDYEANLKLLKGYAAYELRRDLVGISGLQQGDTGAVREEILNGLEYLAAASGDESADDGVEDAS